MANVSGRLGYSINSLYNFGSDPTPATGIQNVPIVLQDTTSNVGAVALTDVNGNYLFSSVPNGTYQIVEAFGQSGGIPTPVDFSLNSSVISPPTPMDPPISAAPSIPIGSTRLQSLTRNTLVPITVVGADITGQDFVDAPIGEVPINILQGTIGPINLVTVAQDGEWGTLPNGAPNQSIPATEPFPGIVPSETYTSTPAGLGPAGFYTAVNIIYGADTGHRNTWFSMANHTTFDETSRMMAINAIGNGPSANERIFSTTIAVNPNTYYIGIAWVANFLPNGVVGTAPQIGVRVSNTSGGVIFNSPTQALTSTTVPTWVQTGGPFFTGSNTIVKVEYQSIALGTGGNDYVADDFGVFTLNLSTIIDINKSVNKNITTVGDTLTYTVSLNNSGNVTANSVFFLDTIPIGTSFIPNSVFVNNVNQPSANPGVGFTIGNLGPGGVSTVTFNVSVVSVPSDGDIVNSTNINYNYEPVVGGVTITFADISNTTTTPINFPFFVNPTKSVDKDYATCGDILTYTFDINSNGNATATNILLQDTIPNGTVFINNSVTVNGVSVPGANPNTGITIPNLGIGEIASVTFKVSVNC